MRDGTESKYPSIVFLSIHLIFLPCVWSCVEGGKSFVTDLVFWYDKLLQNALGLLFSGRLRLYRLFYCTCYSRTKHKSSRELVLSVLAIKEGTHVLVFRFEKEGCFIHTYTRGLETFIIPPG